MRKLIVSCDSGLCNRLMSMCTGMEMARVLGREFLSHWPVDIRCGIEFEKLFPGHQVKILGGHDIADLLTAHITVKVYNARLNNFIEYENMSKDDPHDILLAKAWCRLGFPNECFDWSLIKAHFDKLPVNPAIVNTVNETFSKFHGRPVVGVHIRRGGTGDQVDWFTPSTEVSFQERMNHYLNLNPSTMFYLSTDDKDVESRFQQYFGGRLITQTNKVNYGFLTIRKPESIVEALTDLLLLTKTNRIIGNVKSTFSFSASVFGGIPIEWA